MQTWLPVIPKITPTAVVDILAVATLVYNLVQLMRGRRAVNILSGITIVGLVYVIAVLTHLELLRSVLAALAPYTAIALIVIFQSELRRLLARLGRSRWLGLGDQLERRELADEILLAIGAMAEERTGALIVVERDIGLRTFVESGVALDANVSRDLLCAIFLRGGALHDGAVIIQGSRVAAAACFLPLTTNPTLSRRLGTRHRAGIGITEETDALAIVVSEETGQIALAFRGDIEPDVTQDRVREMVLRHSGRQSGLRPMREPELKRAEP
jgi:diadenylate cyclase